MSVVLSLHTQDDSIAHREQLSIVPSTQDIRAGPPSLAHESVDVVELQSEE